MTKKAAVYTLGCRVNIYESDAIVSALSDIGYKLTNDISEADVYIINSCAVTAEASRKSVKAARHAKKINPEIFIIFCGCGAEEKKDIIDEEYIDAVVGSSDKINNIAKITRDLYNNCDSFSSSVFSDFDSSDYTEKYVPAFSYDNHSRAFIKIQDGCNMKCTYCIIPFLRGKSRSRDEKDVLNEIKVLTENGYTDFTLTGIELCAYKHDIADLAGKIAENEKVRRIRLGSLDPRFISEDFIGRLSQNDKICPHFHISVQSGSDSILRQMNRGYTRETVISGVNIIKKFFPSSTFSADIIAGFPGETDDDFSETVSLCKEICFMHIHAFPYSKRKNTAAEKMDCQIPQQIKKERVRVLNRLGDENYIKIKKEKLSLPAEQVLFEEKEGNYFRGRYTDYTEIFVEGNSITPGRYYNVKAEEINENQQLTGKIIQEKS